MKPISDFTYDVEISPRRRPRDWQFMAGPFLAVEEARKYIDWQREIDAKPPVGHYYYRIVSRETAETTS